MLVVEATRDIRELGFVHSLKKDQQIMVPRGTQGLIDQKTMPRQGYVTVVFDHGIKNSVTMEVPVDCLAKEGARPLPLP